MKAGTTRVVIVTLSFLLFTQVVSSAEPILAVTDEGSIVRLYEDGTWDFKYEKSDVNYQQPVLPEQQLYKLAMTERDEDLWVQYFEHYDGVDIHRTIAGIYNYGLVGKGFTHGVIDMNTGVHYDRTDEYIDLLLKGAALSNSHELYSMLPQATVWGINESGSMSNLHFFWELGYRYELKSQFEKALYWYEELRRLFILTGEKLPFQVLGESTLEVIDGKIYLMKLKLSK